MAYNYLFDAVSLLEQCLDELQEVIGASETRNQSHFQLYDLREVLALTEHLLYEQVRILLEHESFRLDSSESELLYSSSPCLSSCTDLLRSVEQRRDQPAEHKQEMDRTEQLHSYYPRRNAADSLLFRLIVALQLCRVRIGDAFFVITGSRKNKSTSVTKAGSRLVKLPMLAASCCAASIFALSYRRRERNRSDYSLLVSSAQAGVVLVSAYWLKRTWGKVWMTAKIAKTMTEIETWNHQWHMIQTTPMKRRLGDDASSLDAEKSRRLIEYALHETPKVSIWHSQGELRFLMLKRAMDVFYASVNTAWKLSKGTSESDAANWQVTLMTAAVASFYTLTGAERMAEKATSSSESARELIQHAWGMVSLPAIKTISLQASRLLKGAAVADRLEIAGVPCFVLSREPAPELAAATKRFRRMNYCRNAPIHTLSTIDEQQEHIPEPWLNSKPFARSCARYRQRDVILHLTGGGFFAHNIASDLPYLLDWSASTGAVVICPEYVLLPEHTFPDALYQVEDVYNALLSGEAVHALGFEANRIVLTGESTGGNLAASLCVKLCMDSDGTPTCLSREGHDLVPDSAIGEDPDHQVAHLSKGTNAPILPCALVLSCPALNLSLELSHSRIVGNQDPVLRSGLLTAISDAYLPSTSKLDPLASPLYATDSVLSRFPPTLVFASSNDPLLDDSVVLNQRLRSLGVESDLRAAQNLPHAYLGLGTAGFPEAQEVQRQLIDWLNFQLTRDAKDGELNSS